ncbi:homoserine dehydrogenase [Saxibacter everestensis]|uniref:Homoserine dehydrogenase n=1 Tax=Saxibacter everestensis TaxID=2909229 RepID=A0ABY8QNF6_9MICO|nr:homoserine dehydrogenase [Brevibacteriaceae bacterium ZFBP1038]
MAEPLRVALLGCGVVGTEVAQRLTTHAEAYAERIGARLELTGIAVRDTDRTRAGIDPALITDDAEGLVGRADIVVELMGGIEPARSLILKAISHGASVVTANKALLAEHGADLLAAAVQAGVRLEYEAAVAGAIPIVRPVGESLAGDKVQRILGIVNGTTNYVLDKMDSEGWEFDDAVKKAQELGYAEADPTADVGGHDAAAKAAILANLAFHTPVSLSDVYVEGITAVTAADVARAKAEGYAVKLLAICERLEQADGSDGVSARVYPALVPHEHPLASVHGAFNAVFVESEAAGELMFYGQGAGGAPTSSAVLGDIISVARRRVLGGRGQSEPSNGALPLLPIDQIRTRYHITLDVVDRPGVLSKVTEVFASHGVSIETVRQKLAPVDGAGNDGAERAELIIATHLGAESALAATVKSLEKLDVVNAVASTLRVEGLQ